MSMGLLMRPFAVLLMLVTPLPARAADWPCRRGPNHNGVSAHAGGPQKVVKEANQRVPTWVLAGSPVVHENLLLLNLGEGGVALDKATGKVVWNSASNDPGYSSPVPFRRGGEWFAVVSAADTYAAVNVRTGRELWRVKWPTQYGVNAADPVVAGDEVCVSSGYNKGAALLRTAEGEPAVVWKTKNLRNQINSSVLVDGFLD